MQEENEFDLIFSGLTEGEEKISKSIYDEITTPRLKLDMEFFTNLVNVQNIYDNLSIDFFSCRFKFLIELTNSYFRTQTLNVLNQDKNQVITFHNKVTTQIKQLFNSDNLKEIVFNHKYIDNSSILSYKLLENNRHKLQAIINLNNLFILDALFNKISDYKLFKFEDKSSKKSTMLLLNKSTKDFISLLKSLYLKYCPENSKQIISQKYFEVDSSNVLFKDFANEFNFIFSEAEDIKLSKEQRLLGMKRKRNNFISNSMIKIASKDSLVGYEFDQNGRLPINQNECFMIYDTHIYECSEVVNFVKTENTKKFLNFIGPSGVGKTLNLLTLNLFNEELSKNSNMKILSLFLFSQSLTLADINKEIVEKTLDFINTYENLANLDLNSDKDECFKNIQSLLVSIDFENQEPDKLLIRILDLLKTNLDLVLITIDNAIVHTEATYDFLLKIKDLKSNIKYIVNNSKCMINPENTKLNDIINTKEIFYIEKTILNKKFEEFFIFSKLIIPLLICSSKPYGIIDEIQNRINFIKHENQTNSNPYLLHLVAQSLENFNSNGKVSFENYVTSIIHRHLEYLYREKFENDLDKSNTNRNTVEKIVSIFIDLSYDREVYFQFDEELKTLSNQVDFRFFQLEKFGSGKKLKFVHPYFKQLVLDDKSNLLLRLKADKFWDEYLKEKNTVIKGFKLEQVFSHLLIMPMLSNFRFKNYIINDLLDLNAVKFTNEDRFLETDFICKVKYFETAYFSDILQNLYSEGLLVKNSTNTLTNYIQKESKSSIHLIDGATVCYKEQGNNSGINICFFQATVGKKTEADIFNCLREILVLKDNIKDKNTKLHFHYYFIVPDDRFEYHNGIIKSFIQGTSYLNSVNKNIETFFYSLGVIVLSKYEEKFSVTVTSYEVPSFFKIYKNVNSVDAKTWQHEAITYFCTTCSKWLSNYETRFTCKYCVNYHHEVCVINCPWKKEEVKKR